MPKRTSRARTVPPPATPATVAGLSNGEYEQVALEGGGYKRRRVGAKHWQYICEHGRRRSDCKECGGSQICEHGRQRSLCKECGGASICEHGRRRSRRKDRTSSSAPARRAPSRASEVRTAASDGAADDSGHETATYVDEAAPNYVRPRNRRAVVKQEDAGDDSGYDTATLEEGSSFVRPLGRPKVKEEERSD